MGCFPDEGPFQLRGSLGKITTPTGVGHPGLKTKKGCFLIPACVQAWAFYFPLYPAFWGLLPAKRSSEHRIVYLSCVCKVCNVSQLQALCTEFAP